MRPLVAAAVFWATGSNAQIELELLPETPALGYAVRAYEAIWSEDGERIVAALEEHTCLPFAEPALSAIVADATSHSGGPEHPMQLRATYAPDLKRATLVHEIGHRHLWQLEERLDDIDGHRTLYLVLDRVWAEIWGEQFAEERVRGESGWDSRYEYADAWEWARSLTAEERAALWNELLSMNGFPGCDGSPP